MLSDDDTRAEFARMRETVLREVRPPGTAAAHLTLTRRRRRLAAASSAVFVVAVAGGVAFAQPKPGPPVTTPLVIETTEAGSAAPPPDTRVHPSLPETTALHDVTRMRVKAGNAGPLRFTFVCSGSGSGRATVKSETASVTVTVTCGTPPVSTPIELDAPPDPAWVDFAIDWDAGTRLTVTPDGWALQVLDAEGKLTIMQRKST